MSEFFLELFSEEIPSRLQTSAREMLSKNFKDFFDKENIEYSQSYCFSTPNRLLIFFKEIKKEVIQESEEIRGPNINAPDKALEGFLRSNNIEKNKVYKKNIDRGEFYFFKKPKTKIKSFDLLEKNIPQIIDKIYWKKSMKWGDFELSWARPLKSILAVFDKKVIKFNYHHLVSGNSTFVDKEFEEKIKSFSNFNSYHNYFKKLGIIIDQDLRKKIIIKELEKNAKKQKLFVEIDNKLLDEVVNIVEKPNVIICKFDSKFLDIPTEILITSMKHHQKYFHTIDNNKRITNKFLVVANNIDTKNFIRSGNERVVEARLNDAQFFWNKNKSHNLVKQVSQLKNMNYFKGLGSYFDKIQRIRKLGGIISDELLISKEKVELSSSICKVDLMSDLVGEFPELQGVMGGYFAEAQGFDKDICLAIKEHYQPLSFESKTPKKLYSIALSLSDKLDTLVGFFGTGYKPTSSKDPYALRRIALGLIRLVIENRKEFKIKDLINYSINLYDEQSFKFTNKNVQNDLNNFLMERVKFYMKEKEIRFDIIEAALNSFGLDQITKIYQKSLVLNKVINKEIGTNIISSYKRASNILEAEIKNNELEISNKTDPVLFENDYEKNLYQKIHELRKYFTSINKDENYELTLENLSQSKEVIFDFFDNVKVNDDNKSIQKNRLELLQMLCKTFDNYTTFSSIENLQ